MNKIYLLLSMSLLVLLASCVSTPVYSVKPSVWNETTAKTKSYTELGKFRSQILLSDELYKSGYRAAVIELVKSQYPDAQDLIDVVIYTAAVKDVEEDAAAAFFSSSDDEEYAHFIEGIAIKYN